MADSRSGGSRFDDAVREAAARYPGIPEGALEFFANAAGLRDGLIGETDVRAGWPAPGADEAGLEIPAAGTTWRHCRSGTPYDVLGACKLEADNETAVLYREAGRPGAPVWARALRDWHAQAGDPPRPRFLRDPPDGCLLTGGGYSLPRQEIQMAAYILVRDSILGDDRSHLGAAMPGDA